ncbi:hypothetical protein [Carboxylicivirga sp. N1Y90]|uniref:hypothetical protein n=1 Tax=Carboxylicivirga fragile TaxID=3417571 RepID=UPI003D32B208|nr:hypothetical protein [Marinilabiliaceae bacterium N1Y90]
MVKYWLLFIKLLIVGVASSQSSKCDIEELKNSRQYFSLYKCLEEADPLNTDVELVLQKVDLALDYYTSSYYHRAFGYTNLREGERLEDIRQTTEASNDFSFNVDSVLLKLIDTYPNDYRLHLGLGKYYKQVFLLFGDRWGRKSEWLLEQSKYYLTEAYRNGVYDSYSLYVLGYYNTIVENYHDARYWYQKSIQLKDDALCNYNLAIACLFDGAFVDGLLPAKRAYELFQDSLKKGDAARITGIMLSKREQHEDALFYFEQANSLSPSYKPNQLYLLRTFLKLNREVESYDLALEILEKEVYKPDVLEEYLELFEQEDAIALLRKVFDATLVAFENDDEAVGNILFHFAKLEFRQGKKKKCKRYLKQSKERFSNVFDEGHQVFQALDQMLNHL